MLEVAALRTRRDRERHGLTLVDGVREIRRAIDAGASVVEVFACDPLLAGPEAKAALDAIRASRHAPDAGQRDRVREARVRRAGRRAARGRPHPGPALERLTLPADPLVVVIEAVEKPGNVGAVLRSADGAGADALIAASPRTDLYNPNAIRASAGTVFSVPLAAAPSSESSPGPGRGGLRIVTTRVDAERSYVDADLRGPLAIVLGAETDGLTDVWQGAAVEAVRIPMHGTADSLNVSVSAAILLYEARRQRERHGGRAD